MSQFDIQFTFNGETISELVANQLVQRYLLPSSAHFVKLGLIKRVEECFVELEFALIV